jgi:glyoxylase-like metal-dependent hydrolase (beta-lactamase superfamily II)
MADTDVLQHSVVPIEETCSGPPHYVCQCHAEGSWTLIDAGLPFSARHIHHWAEEHFGVPPLAIVLTHGHFDHVSGAAELADRWAIPIYAHPLESPYLTGQQEYPALTRGLRA